MKKILKLSLALLVICSIMIGNVYAALSCNVSISADKTEFNKGEEFTLNVKLSNIQSDRGVISLATTLQYDKDSLTLVKMEGQNGWETPTEGTSYNPENGKMAITRNGLGKTDEVIFKMTFKVKEESKQNLTISLNNLSVADGDQTVKFDNIKQDIVIKEGSQNNSGTNQNTNQSTNQNTNSGTNQATNQISNNKTQNSSSNTNVDKTMTDKKLPQTGNSDNIWLAILGSVALIVVMYSLIRIKSINKTIKNGSKN